MSSEESNMPESSEKPAQGECPYKYKHKGSESKPEFCGRDLHKDHPSEGKDGEHYCLWHCTCEEAMEFKQSPECKSRLEQDVKNGEYLEGAYLNGACLRDATLTGAHLEGAALNYAHLEGARLGGAHLQRAQLPGAFLKGAWLDGACLQDADLQGADLRDGPRDGEDQATHLQGTCLEGADFRGARLEGAHLVKARMHHASLYGATLDARTNCDEIHWCQPAEERGTPPRNDPNLPKTEVYRRGCSVLRTIGQYYRQRGDYEKSQEFYDREMTCQQRLRTPWLWRTSPWVVLRDWLIAAWQSVLTHSKSLLLKRVLRAIGRFLRALFWRYPLWYAHRWGWGYGMKPWLVLFWMAVVIVICAVWFHCGEACLGWREALWVSLGAFSTVGFTKHPAPQALYSLAVSEALLGVLLCAAFLVSLATKYVHRD